MARGAEHRAARHARAVRREALNLVAHSLMLLRFEGAERSSERSGGGA